MRKCTALVAIACALVAAPAFAQTSGSNESVDLDVTVDVVEACDISLTNDIAFSDITATSGKTTVASTDGVISVLCTVGTNYYLKFDGGDNYDSVGALRRMSDGQTTPTYLSYTLLDSSDAAIAKDGTVSGTATGSAQTVSVGAELSSSNGNVPAGTYSDTITVTVSIATS